jgi:hypothetical protein
MLSLFLLALSATVQDQTDGFGMRLCGIQDLDGDGTDDLWSRMRATAGARSGR